MAMTFACGRYQSSELGDGVTRSVVYATGTKLLHIVIIDFPVRVLSVPRSEEKFIHELTLGAAPYPLKRAAKEMLGAGKRKGITHRAKALLEAAIASMTMEEKELEDQMNDVENPAPVDESTSTAATAAEGDSTTVPATPAKPKRVRKAKAVTTDNAETPATAEPATQETTMATKKKARKGKAAKAKTKRVAKPKGESKRTKGAGGFIAGTAKEKAFVAFKEARKEYAALEHGTKKDWVAKLANKLGVKPGTVASWIGGDFAKALAK